MSSVGEGQPQPIAAATPGVFHARRELANEVNAAPAYRRGFHGLRQLRRRHQVRIERTAIVLDAGVWKEGTIYVPGDGVSFGNSFFIAQTATSAKPPCDDWRLAVRAGRDGRDYRPDNDKPPTKPVRFK